MGANAEGGVGLEGRKLVVENGKRLRRRRGEEEFIGNQNKVRAKKTGGDLDRLLDAEVVIG